VRLLFLQYAADGRGNSANLKRLFICLLGCILSLLSRLQKGVIATAHLSFNLTPCPVYRPLSSLRVNPASGAFDGRCKLLRCSAGRFQGVHHGRKQCHRLAEEGFLDIYALGASGFKSGLCCKSMCSRYVRRSDKQKIAELL